MKLNQLRLLVFVMNNLYSGTYLKKKDLKYFDKHHYKNNYIFETENDCEKYIKRFLKCHPEYEPFVNDYQRMINDFYDN